MDRTFFRLLCVIIFMFAGMAQVFSDAWWKAPQGPAYQVLVYSFADGNGDGYGDLKGLKARLDYLNNGKSGTSAQSPASLNVEALWLSPISPSPSYHGYDVTDYKAIDPRLGTMADFEAFVAEAHKRNIKVILDLVFNHSSNQHPWFKSWVQNPDGPHKDYYVERKPGTSYGSGGMGKFYPAAGREYFAAFWDGMPDLNLANPRVVQELKDIMAFWIGKGVDGFRFDAVKHSFDLNEMPQGTGTLSLNKTLWRDLVSYGRSLKPDLFTIGEVLSENVAETSSWNGVYDSLFDFPTAKNMLNISSSMSPGNLVDSWIRGQKQYERNGPWSPSVLLGNHDQDRVMSTILARTGGNRIEATSRAKMLGSILFTLPGLPWIYYGEELGMEGRRWANDDINRRLAMPWASKSKDDNFASWVYTSGKTESGINDELQSVKVQNAQTDSLLNHYRSLAQLRLTFPALGNGTLSKTSTELGNQSPDLLSWVVSNQDQSLLVLHNLGTAPVNPGLASPLANQSSWSSLPLQGATMAARSTLIVVLPRKVP